MYRVVSIEDDEMTRFIELVNIQTGTKEVCFDDSSLVGDENFDGMVVGNEYQCKIKLFGTVKKNENSVRCRIVDCNVIIGNKEMVKVLVEKDTYYIPKNKITPIGDLDEFDFYYTRKDLIQVNNVIHADMF